MFIFLSLMIGIAATLCAVPLLLLLGGMSLVGTIDVIVTMRMKTDSLFAFGGLIWCWAGFYGLSGYWRWVDIQGKELEENDIERLINIRKKGIWGLLAFLPVLPAFSWFAIPLLCFVFYIFIDIKQKLDTLRG
ncbi:hypothetical protein FK216_11665 [Moraxellaceae bacterium AER2_44_116]|nr:hypothetical protein [Moraxellaceae bacterium]TQC96588.1 hypothetical protein FK216_11665 [Moraxellaceae bacterium AER2_44_116]